MPECPRCHQPVTAQAVTCPACRIPLKAHGHPGIPLYHATGEAFLCDTCLYHADDTCTYPKRPYAKDCTLYSDRTQPVQATPAYSRSFLMRSWLRHNSGWLLLLGLLIISLILALSQ